MVRYESVPLEDDMEDPLPVNLELEHVGSEAPPPKYEDDDACAVPPTYDEVARIKAREEGCTFSDGEEASPFPFPRRITFGVPQGVGGIFLMPRHVGDDEDSLRSEEVLGDDCTFLLTFCISLLLNWVGLLAYCVSRTVAARAGAISGMGLSLMHWTIYMYRRNYYAAQHHGAGSPDAPHQHKPEPALALLWLPCILGVFMFFIGVGIYTKAKRLHRLRLAEPTSTNVV